MAECSLAETGERLTRLGTPSIASAVNYGGQGTWKKPKASGLLRANAGGPAG
jgi:hypothetical protein